MLVVIGTCDVDQLSMMGHVTQEILHDVTRTVHGDQPMETGGAKAMLDAMLVEEVVRDVSLVSIGSFEVEQTVDGEVPVGSVMVRGDVPEDTVELGRCLIHDACI